MFDTQAPLPILHSPSPTSFVLLENVPSNCRMLHHPASDHRFPSCGSGMTRYPGDTWGTGTGPTGQVYIGPESVGQNRCWSNSQDREYRERERRPHLLSPVAPQQSGFLSDDMLSTSFSFPSGCSRQFSAGTSYSQHSDDLSASPSSWSSDWDSMSQPESPDPYHHRLAGTSASWPSSANTMLTHLNGSSEHLSRVSSPDTVSSLLFPGEQPIRHDGYTFHHTISPIPSPSPSPSHFGHATRSPTTSTCLETAHSRRGTDARSEGGKKCSHCQATSTPLWRRDPSTLKPLCNACGLYLQQRNKLRPQELIDADDDGHSSEESDVNYVGPECSHCHTHHTSVWRRSKSGDQLCNACGVYARLRGKPRPLTLKKKKIRPRSKHGSK